MHSIIFFVSTFYIVVPQSRLCFSTVISLLHTALAPPMQFCSQRRDLGTLGSISHVYTPRNTGATSLLREHHAPPRDRNHDEHLNSLPSLYRLYIPVVLRLILLASHLVDVFLAFDNFFLPKLEQHATHHRGLEEHEASALIPLAAVVLEQSIGLRGSSMARGTTFNVTSIYPPKTCLLCGSCPRKNATNESIPRIILYQVLDSVLILPIHSSSSIYGTRKYAPSPPHGRGAKK